MPCPAKSEANLSQTLPSRQTCPAHVAYAQHILLAQPLGIKARILRRIKGLLMPLHQESRRICTCA